MASICTCQKGLLQHDQGQRSKFVGGSTNDANSSRAVIKVMPQTPYIPTVHPDCNAKICKNLFRTCLRIIFSIAFIVKWFIQRPQMLRHGSSLSQMLRHQVGA